LPQGVLQNDLGKEFGYPRLTWAIHLYPLIEQKAIYDRFSFTLGSNDTMYLNDLNSAGPDSITAIVLPTMMCPTDGNGSRGAWTFTFVGPNSPVPGCPPVVASPFNPLTS